MLDENQLFDIDPGAFAGELLRVVRHPDAPPAPRRRRAQSPRVDLFGVVKAPSSGRRRIAEAKPASTRSDAMTLVRYAKSIIAQAVVARAPRRTPSNACFVIVHRAHDGYRVVADRADAQVVGDWAYFVADRADADEDPVSKDRFLAFVFAGEDGFIVGVSPRAYDA